MQAEAGNEFVSRRRKQGKLPNQTTLRTDLRLILPAYSRATDPNQVKSMEELPLLSECPAQNPRMKRIPVWKTWERADPLCAESTEKEADGKLATILGTACSGMVAEL